jgi:hypothetical protein
MANDFYHARRNNARLYNKMQQPITMEVVGVPSHELVRTQDEGGRFPIGAENALRMTEMELCFGYDRRENSGVIFDAHDQAILSTKDLGDDDSMTASAFVALNGLPYSIGTRFHGVVALNYMPGDPKNKKLTVVIQGMCPVQLNCPVPIVHSDVLVALRPLPSKAGSSTTVGTYERIQHLIMPLRTLCKDGRSYSAEISQAAHEVLVEMRAQIENENKSDRRRNGGNRMTLREMAGLMIGRVAETSGKTLETFRFVNGGAKFDRDFVQAFMIDAFWLSLRFLRDDCGETAAIADRGKAFFRNMHQLATFAVETLVEAERNNRIAATTSDVALEAAFLRSDILRIAMEYAVMFTSSAAKQFKNIVGISCTDGKGPQTIYNLFLPGGARALIP